MAKKNKLKFDELPRENPFSVPEGYFDNFSNQLREKIKSEELIKTESSRKSRIIHIMKNQLALAASFVAFAVISYFSIQFILNSPNAKNSELNYSEIVEYNLEDYEMDLLMDCYSENIDSDEIQDEYEQEIIDYLIAENIDIQLIIEEL